MPDSTLPRTVAHTGGDPDPLGRIGEIVDGRYRLLEFIGQGGMGNVYRGEHITIRKAIALKILHPSLATIPELRSRFEREAYAIGRIEHPNCVEVSDFGELSDGSLFLAMEYLDGESAADLLDRERPLEQARALQIARHTLAGLAHAHRAGIVHRDVKPENIFILKNPEDPSFAKILDFGIAKLLEQAEEQGGREKLTQAGITFGTPAYLSPEQAIGDPADTRSDLYSVAVVLFELLTGTAPFASHDKMELLAMHAGRDAPTLVEKHAEGSFSPELEAIVARGLAKRRKDRFQSADEFIAAIDALALFPRPPSFSDGQISVPLTYTPVALTPARPPEGSVAGSSISTPKELPWPLIGFVAAGLLLIIGTVIWLSGRTRTVAGIEQTEPSDVAIEAEAHLKDGDTNEAIEVLTAQRSSETDASAQLRLGHAYAFQAEYDNATSAYGRALLLDENSIRDTALIANLRLMIDENGPIYFEALRLLVEYARDENDIKRLVELASAKKLEVRQQAFAMAEKLGHDGKIDRVRAFLYDLVQEPLCEERRKAVARLRALGESAGDRRP